MSFEDVAIRVSGLGKRYLIYRKPFDRLLHLFFQERREGVQQHVALDDVSFEIRRGETVGIVGKNGSGKSTLLQLISGTLAPDDGELQVHGKVAALLELGAGFNPEFTGEENLALCAQIYGLDQETLAARTPDIIRFADIGDHLSQAVKTYSSGMFMRLAFSVVAHVDADILIIDEALAVGDAFFVQKCMRFLQDFKARGGTILFVSHDMNAVRSLCDRVVWLENGRVRSVGDPDGISKMYLAALYNTHTAAADPQVEQRGGDEPDTLHDARRDLLNQSNLRNDLEVFYMPGNSSRFGSGGAVLESIRLEDPSGRALSWVVGGESVRLSMTVKALRDVRSLVAGFFVKDSRGQPLFGDNTCLTYLGRPFRLEEGESCDVVFEFRMPTMPAGEYAVSVAISDGDQREHEVYLWLHEAMVIVSHSAYVPSGLVGVPMHRIEIRR